MTITSFDRQNLPGLRRDIDEALKAVADKHGITFAIGRITFSGSEFRAKMTANTGSSADMDQAKAFGTVADLARLSSMHNLPEDLLGRKITVRGSHFTISGVKLSRRKYPFSVTGARGGKYKMSVEDIRGGLDG